MNIKPSKTQLMFLLILILILSMSMPLTTAAKTEQTIHYRLGELWSSGDQGSYVYGLDWSPNGKYIVIGTADGYLKVYDALSGKCLWKLRLNNTVQFVDWSPKGRYIAVATLYAVYVIDAYSHEITWYRYMDTIVYVAVWSPDGEYLAIGTQSKLYIFTETGSLFWVSPEYYDAEIRSVAWSHEGDMIAFAGGDLGYELKIYKLTYMNASLNITQGIGNASTVLVSSYNIDDKICSIGWSPDDKFVAIGDCSYYIHVISIHGTLIWRGTGHTIIGVVWSPDEEYLAILDHVNIQLYTKVGDLLWRKPVDILTSTKYNYNNGIIAWGPDHLIAVGGLNKIYVFDINGSVVAEAGSLDSYYNTVRIAWSPDKKYLASVGEDRKLHVWRLEEIVYPEIIVEKTTYPYKICFVINGTTVLCDMVNTTNNKYSLEPGVYMVTYHPLAFPANTAGNTSNVELKEIREFKENNTYTLVPPDITQYFLVTQIRNPLPKDLVIRITWETGYRDYRIGPNSDIKVYTVPGTKYLVYVKAENNTWIKIYELQSIAGKSTIINIPENIFIEKTTTPYISTTSQLTASTTQTTLSTTRTMTTTQIPTSKTQTSTTPTQTVTSTPSSPTTSIYTQATTQNTPSTTPGEKPTSLFFGLTTPYILAGTVSLGLLAIILYRLKHRPGEAEYTLRKARPVAEKTMDLVTGEVSSLARIEELLQTRLQGLKKGYSCSSEWMSARLLKGTVPDEFVGEWSCCKLGCGGWGCSYLCRRNGREIVVKIPHGYEPIIYGGLLPSIHVRLLEKIKERAETIKQLNHPNILKLLGVGKQVPILIYEYADYGTLEWQLANGWIPSKRDLLLLTLQVADALRYIHGRGLIHGDIKPNNIFLVKGVAKIGDFSGLKKLLSLTSSKSGIASTYTIGFRAPEQVYSDLREQTRKRGLEHMIDIYCLGNTLLYTLTGETIDGEDATPEKIDKAVSKIDDPQLRTLIKKMLDPKPWNRPTAMDIVRAVLKILEESS